MQSENTQDNASASSAGQTGAESNTQQPAAFNPEEAFEPITVEDIIAVHFGLRPLVTYEDIFGNGTHTAQPGGATVALTHEDFIRELEFAEFCIALEAAYQATLGPQAQATNPSSETQATAGQGGANTTT
ncbi:hypothetical protein AURDEDRAFT_127849 [Auricularia subglabra TFB-10046 SS5]|uniref:Uncharacterized protein n=1 Tax=Auricularia subglabra (strain TFB-10046 / SS5) TaxID=717982 RepID=J0WY15_AURST|nr:hypothetical protein AURDEDRAFT_127849 [Auricularia subglabra TFB-10046 SS5]